MAKNLTKDEKTELLENKYNSSYDPGLDEFKTEYVGRQPGSTAYKNLSSRSATGPDLMNIHKKFGGKRTNAAQVAINRNRARDYRKKPKYSK